MKKCIMAMVAHADDMEVFAGGAMAKLVEQGYEGVQVLLTASMAGVAGEGKKRSETTPSEVIPLRREEATTAAAILGVHTIERFEFQNMLYSDGTRIVWMGDDDFNCRHPDAGPLLPAVAINARLVEPVVDVLCRYEPEIVIGQHLTSGSEHLCAGHIVNLAFRLAVKRGASLGQLWLPAVIRHCTWASDIRLYPSPNILIDITAQWGKKEWAMLAHTSQHLENGIERIRLINRYWGIAAECELAEPFFTLCDARYR